jgi:hypothetical protein
MSQIEQIRKLIETLENINKIQLKESIGDTLVEVRSHDSTDEDGTLEWTGKLIDYVKDAAENPGIDQAFEVPPGSTVNDVVSLIWQAINKDGEYFISGFTGVWFTVRLAQLD